MVYYDDYARLKADLRNCYTAIRVKEEEKARLKAEVERLTKAGDWMMADLIPYQQFDGFKSVKDWNAAKGVQS
jgi:hypothetical protein